jgi:CRISPR/Cas system-associated exonuclease Cas4 (RecB family)
MLGKIGTMRLLSKSKLLSFRQCPKKLWLENHHPELAVTSAATAASYSVGNAVGAVARQLYDPEGRGELVDVGRMGYESAFRRSRELLESAQPIFEAGFTTDGAMAFADVMLPIEKNGSLAWRMVEVKSATGVKDYYRHDAAIQAFVARCAGIRLESIAIAYVDKTFDYAGDRDYQGFLREEDVTEETLGREEEVREWIADAHAIVGQASEPERPTGDHCEDPFPCGFQEYCRSREHPVEYPVSWLPNVRTKALKTHIAGKQVTDLRQVPDELLNPVQQRVKAHTLSRQPYFDSERAAEELAQHRPPAFFLDFETIGFAVPIWKGTRPYQPMTFQFSVHRIGPDGQIAHRDFLDLSGADPREALAEALIEACEKRGPVFVYSSFEASRIEDLKKQFPRFKPPLSALLKRLVDLRPIAEQCYYHPSQEGSWSIKKVLPALTGRGYEELDGVKDGGMAMEAYLEAIAPETTAERKADIERELRKYCALDTEAMILIWKAFRRENRHDGTVCEKEQLSLIDRSQIVPRI